VGVSNLDLRTGRQSLYVGVGNGPLNGTITNSGNGELRLFSFRFDTVNANGNVLPGLYPVGINTTSARNALFQERINIFDAIPFIERAGGLFINV
jgi:hypothetical protein